jgi:hypothetical protein
LSEPDVPNDEEEARASRMARRLGWMLAAGLAMPVACGLLVWNAAAACDPGVACRGPRGVLAVGLALAGCGILGIAVRFPLRGMLLKAWRGE